MSSGAPLTPRPVSAAPRVALTAKGCGRLLKVFFLKIIYWETGAACDYLGRDVQFADAAVPKLE